jgi:microcystin-dependent protein
MDVHEVAAIIAAAGGGSDLRLRLGTVTAVAGDGTFSATIAGSTTAVSGIRAFGSVNPVVGKGIWLAVQGSDVFGVGEIGSPVIPSGLIVMWSGTIATIPAGWALCNGANGTPDLRDKFVVGARADSGGAAQSTVSGASTQTGGAASSASDSQGAHTHTAPASGGYTLQLADIPSHRHSLSFNIERADAAGTTNTHRGTAAGRENDAPVTDYAGGGGSHAHPSGGLTDSQGAHTHTVPTLPPYYALAFIMKL